MGSLSNLFISESYQSLLHFGNNSSASATLVEIEDGVGNGLGLSLNTNGDASLDGNLLIGGDFIVSGTFDIEGKVTINDNVRVNGNLEVSGSTTLTGSLVVSNQITASNGFIINDLNVGGTLFANKVVTLIESASVIFSSGSNILGDDISDIQTLNGLVIMSGSSELTGSMGITGDLNVLGNISSSTISGIGNSFLFSQSVDSRLDFLEVPFSTSVDSRLDALEAFTASQGLVTTSSFQSYTASVDADLAAIHQTTASLNTFSQSTNAFTQSTNAFTQSTNVSINALNQFSGSTITSISNINAYTQSTNTRIDVLASFTASYVTTGSNTYTGEQIFSSSVRGQVINLSVVSQTASIDLSLGNFFTLTLPTASTTRLNPTNIRPGETVQLLISQQSVTGSLTYPSNMLFATGSDYSASVIANAKDIVSFVSFDTASIYAVSIKNLV